MSLNRRTFLKSSSILVGGIILQGNNTLANILPVRSKNLKQLQGGVGVYTEKGGTIGWYVNGDTVIVIDSQFPDSAKNFKNDLSSKTYKGISYLFNTHHHKDHTMGNYFLRDYSEKIVAHTNCPKLQIAQNKGTESESMVVTADFTFKEEINILLPKEKLTAKHFGPAHTSGDIVVHFENANIAHLGDLVFNNVYPKIDNKAEGSVVGWIEVLNKIATHYDKDTKFIFGHADSSENVIGDKKEIIAMKDYLSALNDYVASQVKDGKSSEEIAESDNIPNAETRIELWEGARQMNLQSAAEQQVTVPDNKTK